MSSVSHTGGGSNANALNNEAMALAAGKRHGTSGGAAGPPHLCLATKVCRAWAHVLMTPLVLNEKLTHAPLPPSCRSSKRPGACAPPRNAAVAVAAAVMREASWTDS